MKEYQITTDDALREQVGRDFPGYSIIFDESLTLPAAYLEQIRQGQKTTTIKFKDGYIRLPKTELPAIEKETGRQIGTVSYSKVAIKANCELTEQDAMGDGFATLGDFNVALEDRYGKVSPEALLSVHRFDRFKSLQ